MTKESIEDTNEIKDLQDELYKLSANIISIHKDKKRIVTAKGHKFKVRFPKRIVYDKIVEVGLKVNKNGENMVLRDKNADVKVCAYILLHNPILIFFFLRIYMFYLKWRYDSEVFCAIIDNGINPKDIEAFYKSSMSIMSLSQAKMAMMQL